MQAETNDDMALYIPPEKPWLLRLRSTESFQARLEGVVRLWRMHAVERGDDAAQIDVSYVVRRVLEAGIDQAFAEYGGEPKSAETWAAVQKAVTAAHKKQSR